MKPTLYLASLVFTLHVRLSYATAPRDDSLECKHAAGLAATKNLIIRGGAVVTMAEGERKLLRDAVIHVCEGRIAFIGHTSDHESFAAGCEARTLQLGPEDVVLPAFINAHTHAAMSLFKNLGNDRALADWLHNYIFPLENALVDKRFCRVGATLAMVELLGSGVSTFADMYFFQTAVAEEVARVGMRAFLGQGIIDFPQPDSATPNDTLRLAERHIERWIGHELVTPFVAPHAPYTTNEWVYRAAVALNRKHGLRTWTHCSDDEDEHKNFRTHQGIPAESNMTSTEWLRDIGVLGPDTVCAHAVSLKDSDIDIFKQTGTSVAHCPSSNLKLGSGFMRYSALKNAGITIAIGTDGQASNNDVDMIEEARIASLIHKGVDKNPATMDAYTTLRHMTVGGAKILGREKEQGSLEVNKYGDIVVFRGKSVKFSPRFDIGKNGTESVDDTAALIVYNSNAYDVKATIVNGRVLYKDSCYPTIDVDTLLNEVSLIGDKVRGHLVMRSGEEICSSRTSEGGV